MRIKVALLGVICMSSVALKAVNDPVIAAKKSKKPLVVFFTKNSCPFCVWLKPFFNQLKTKAGDTSFLVVDVSSNPTYFKRTYQFSTVPTVVYYNKEGKEVGRHGSNNKQIHLKEMHAYLTKARV